MSVSNAEGDLVAAASPPPSGRATGSARMSAGARDAVVYVLRTFASPAGLRGLAGEGLCLAVRVANYPWGLAHEHISENGSYYGHYRTDTLSPARRSLVISDMQAAGTPILLVHGFMDNRSVFSVFRGALRRRGFGVVHGVNYSMVTALTGDVRTAAHDLRRHVDRLRERTGSERVHLVGHSLGGLIARYLVQRLGGDEMVHTLVTLGSPHRGSLTAHLLPTPLTRQLLPGSDLLAELDEPAPNCRTRFLVVWSRMDQLIVPQRNARLDHPDLTVDTLELRSVGHLSLPIHPRTVHWVANSLTRLEDEPNGRPRSLTRRG
jgi:pimeloyl-ACP methyl ester carboxylesterase